MPEFLKDQKHIKAWLSANGLLQISTISLDGVVDVTGPVMLQHSLGDLTQLPIQFGRVSGAFWCANNNLTTLVGAPSYVGQGFWCDKNQLTSLVGAPKSVGAFFGCSHNRLNNLIGSPEKVNGIFYCDHNPITSLEGAPDFIGSDMIFANTEVLDFTGINTVKGDIYPVFAGRHSYLGTASNTILKPVGLPEGYASKVKGIDLEAIIARQVDDTIDVVV